jgi:hypothetical protein
MNMEDYLPQGQPTVEVEFSHQANVLQSRGLVMFAAGLVALGILALGIIGVMMTGFSHEVAGMGAIAPARFADDAGRFPAPQLQPNPDVDLVEMKKRELDQLNGYGWVDRKVGVAHIPIDRAIDILTKTGLPLVKAKAPEPSGPAAPSSPAKQGPKR